MEHVFARKVDHAIRGSILKLAYVTLVLADALPRHWVAIERRHVSPPPPRRARMPEAAYPSSLGRTCRKDGTCGSARSTHAVAAHAASN